MPSWNEDSEQQKMEAFLIRKELSKTYPEELATSDPEHYWINPKDGECHKRGEAQFFINVHGHVIPVPMSEYDWKKAYFAKNAKEKEGKGEGTMNSDIV